MWEPRRLTTLRASTACYRDSFTNLLHSSFYFNCIHCILLHCLLPTFPPLPECSLSPYISMQFMYQFLGPPSPVPPSPQNTAPCSPSFHQDHFSHHHLALYSVAVGSSLILRNVGDNLPDNVLVTFQKAVITDTAVRTFAPFIRHNISQKAMHNTVIFCHTLIVNISEALRVLRIVSRNS
jgi:hypothetical protein